ncbi:M48 family metallopeptidase [Roseovarius sp. TE539]|uniref:tetratricopeptide repeat protein n=1 Tax=Roseovarius sp. TE539 TaxID=2249812 RepID=UPI0015EE689B|nr:cytochrome c3 family protein [Roseovarius sp. TE539]
MPRSGLISRICITAFTLVLALASNAEEPGTGGHGTMNLLAREGIEMSVGDAAGYVPDAVCGDCHADKAESFAEMGMARSFYRPSADNVIEDFSQLPYHHAPSGRYYRLDQENGVYRFTRYRKASDGTRLDEFTTTVDWIMGSGNHARVYLYQTPDGALFQLPLAWYTQSGIWAMAPGFEKPDHNGVLRSVPKGCMACHNSYAEYPKGQGRMGMPNLHPADLPEGIGCQRCHGPGARHVRFALTGETGMEDLRSAIVHPGKLPREELYSICYGCHMQPTVSVMSQVRMGRGHYSFRPGENLQEFRMRIDIVDADRPRADRFEINHHPYRLEQSACFIESEGALGCLNCHDPHVKIKPAKRAAHYRKACMSCHETDGRGLPDLPGTAGTHPEIAAEADGTTCHMPERRTQDVVEVWMTDHKIARAPDAAADLLAPIESEPVDVEQVFISGDEAGMPRLEAEMLKLMAILEYTGGGASYASDDLARILLETRATRYEPWLKLMQSYLRQRKFDNARRVAEHTLGLAPDNPTVATAAGIARFMTGDRKTALTLLGQTVAAWPEMIEPRFQLARFLAVEGRIDPALKQAEEVVRLRPNHWQGWWLIADLAEVKGDRIRAIEAYLKALEIRPEAKIPRRKVVGALRKKGRYRAADHQAEHPAQ